MTHRRTNHAAEQLTFEDALAEIAAKEPDAPRSGTERPPAPPA